VALRIRITSESSHVEGTLSYATAGLSLGCLVTDHTFVSE